MQVAVISLFPEWVEQVVRFGMPRVACERGQLALNVINPRDFADNRWRRVDRPSFGGGPGMVMEAAPMAAAMGTSLLVITVQTLAGFVGKAIPPKSGGVPYVKER